jgi:pimeloyl-ACP methyl ester carboxylesterase
MRTTFILIAMVLCMCAITCPGPAGGSTDFTLTPGFLGDIHQLEVIGNDHNKLQVRISRNGGTRVFRVYIVNGGYDNDWHTVQTDVDMNGDGAFDLTVTGLGASDVCTYTYPEPARWADVYTVKVRLTFLGPNGLCNEATWSLTVGVCKEQRVYVGSEGDYVAQLRVEDCTTRTPVLMVEGIDASNNTNSWKYCQQYPDLLDALYADNCEVFFLNFGDGGASIRHNATIVTDALSKIHTLCPTRQIAVVGFSMGGLVARYALAQTESSGTPHDVGLYISYDTPHGGANMNCSLQDEVAGIVTSNVVVDALKAEMRTVAAKQMSLYDPYDAQADSFYAFHWDADTLNGSGFPRRSFNAAISNGNFTHSVGTGWLQELRHIADLTILRNGEGLPVLTILASDTDLGTGSLVSDQTLQVRGDLFDFPFVGDIDYRLDVNFDPVFIPTWSALGKEAWELPTDCFNIAGDIVHLGAVPFDDYLVQDTVRMHLAMSALSRERLMTWLHRESMLTINYVLPGGGTVPAESVQVPILVGATVSIEPHAVTVDGETVMYVFDTWDDGSTENPRHIFASHDTVRSVVMKVRPQVAWASEVLPAGLRFASSSQSSDGSVLWMGGQTECPYADTLWLGNRLGCSWRFGFVAEQREWGLPSAVGGGPADHAGVLYYEYDVYTQQYALYYGRFTVTGRVGVTLIGSNMPVGPLGLVLDSNSSAHLLYKSTAGYLVYEKIGWSGAVLDGMPVVGPDPMYYSDYESCAIGLTAGGGPVVAFTPFTVAGDYTVAVAYYPTTGSGTTRYSTPAWTVEYPSGCCGGGDAVALALDASDHPHLSYREKYGTPRLVHASWSGTEWVLDVVGVYPEPVTAIGVDGGGLARIATLVPAVGGGDAPMYYYEVVPGVWIAEPAGGVGAGTFLYRMSMGLNEVGHGTIGFSGPTIVSARPGSADVSAPGGVSDLAVIMGQHSAVLRWTASGDDGSTGTADNYDVRWSRSAINEGNFEEAATFDEIPCPSAPGAEECASIQGLNRLTAYYFALKVRDEAGNWSGLSNVVRATTKGTGVEVLCIDMGLALWTGEEWPARLQLAIASPNPTRGPIRLDLEVPQTKGGSKLRVSVHDVSGRLVQNLEVGGDTPGTQTLLWDLSGRGVARVRSGVYYVRAVNGSETVTRAVVVLD